MTLAGLTLSIAALCLSVSCNDAPGPASATARASAPAPPLGTIHFPNSGAPEAQEAFLQGVAWLHSFGYEDAIDAFREAQRIDPGFALAYWGEAMSFSQPLWFFEELESGRAALRKLGDTPAERLAKAGTPREAGYLAAVEALFGPHDLPTRHQNHADAMGELAAKFPDDDEAQVFYALSLLGTLPSGDASLPLREKAGAIAEAVFAENPDHPGAAHYVIHAYDHGALASRALAAARAYAKLAPAASHALHMPAHTFVQLGYWADAAATDEASWNASRAWAAGRNLPQSAWDFHSLTWLQYEWLQLGQFTRAGEAIKIVDEVMGALSPTAEIGGHHYADSAIGRGTGPDALRNDRGSMRARYVIETARWEAMKGQGTFDGIDELFALGFSAAKLGDRARVEAAITEFQKVSTSAGPPDMLSQSAIMLHEMRALHLFAQNRHPEAFAEMVRANALQAKMPKPIGRPYPVKGADELYAELLLEGGHAAEAVEWFEKTLARTPNRSRAVLGLARARAKAGDTAGSREAYTQLLANWKDADPNIPELNEARAALSTP